MSGRAIRRASGAARFRTLGLDRVLLRASAEDLASQRMNGRHGGDIESVAHSSFRQQQLCRYSSSIR
jgi:predicted acetyltransferase